MPRLPRFFVDGVPQHVVQRGHNGQDIFLDDEDRTDYATTLNQLRQRHGCAIHAYVLMDNHVHLLLTPAREDSLPGLLQALNGGYTRRFNRRHGRRGTIWEGRYHASLVDTERYLLACSRYIELNPVRAGLVAGPGDFRWSSYAANALGRADPMVTPHPVYLELATDPAGRQAEYRALVEAGLTPELLDELRSGIAHDHAVGGTRFLELLGLRFGQTMGRRKRGRPRKEA